MSKGKSVLRGRNDSKRKSVTKAEGVGNEWKKKAFARKKEGKFILAWSWGSIASGVPWPKV